MNPLVFLYFVTKNTFFSLQDRSAELDRKLCEKYPKIFADRHADMMATAMCWGFECGDGWFWLIDNLCHCIQNYIDANSKLRDIPQVVATQVKEKYGGLRFYHDGGNELIDGMVWFAEHLSYRICEVCGSTKDVSTTKGWMMTRCAKCLAKQKRWERWRWLRRLVRKLRTIVRKTGTIWK